jgi:hypothetical protein
MLWYHYLIAVIFIAMIASPVWFFGKVGKILFDEKEPHEPFVQHINPNSIIPYSESVEMIHADDKVLKNLDKMIQTSEKKHVKQLWEIKKAEFERQLRWKATVRNHV